MSLHYPKEEYKTQLRDSMERFKKSLENCDGFIEGYTLVDEKTGLFVRMIKWKSKNHMKKNVHLGIETIKNDNYEKWELKPPHTFYLND
ncbi:MAG: hypothetical protein CMF96_06425 [Candidatus Marinimicrobia bacterium]|nr:hypothetical protein [Candidatus Neomarinimicrobiota bacterium]|tara:strand:- start:546 stop:812 length:267 start_codon:yes stop_codon:yes gene_type:complete